MSSHWRSSTATRTGDSAASSQERSEERRRHHAPLGEGTDWVRAEQRDLERVALRIRERTDDVVPDVDEEVAEPGEGEPGLGGRGPAREDAGAPLASELDRGLPESRLPDARLTFEDECRGAGLERREELVDDDELDGTAYDRSRGHRRSLSGLNRPRRTQLLRARRLPRCASTGRGARRAGARRERR